MLNLFIWLVQTNILCDRYTIHSQNWFALSNFCVVLASVHRTSVLITKLHLCVCHFRQTTFLCHILFDCSTIHEVECKTKPTKWRNMHWISSHAKPLSNEWKILNEILYEMFLCRINSKCDCFLSFFRPLSSRLLCESLFLFYIHLLSSANQFEYNFILSALLTISMCKTLNFVPNRTASKSRTE